MKITLTKLSNAAIGSLASQTISISKKETYTVVKDNPLLLQVETEYAGFKAD
ncbi:MAG: hypothetical protein KA206_06120 [Paludibacter sp.]|nr:hypothetical protein [Paludibacter sp.]